MVVSSNWMSPWAYPLVSIVPNKKPAGSYSKLPAGFFCTWRDSGYLLKPGPLHSLWGKSRGTYHPSFDGHILLFLGRKPWNIF
jgi:hypothetical protein